MESLGSLSTQWKPVDCHGLGFDDQLSLMTISILMAAVLLFRTSTQDPTLDDNSPSST